MKQYLDLLKYILDNGEDKDDRTGVGTRSVFGYQLRFNLRYSFPAVTTKRLAWKACVGELLWFLEGSRDERRLAEITHGTRDGVSTIWTPNALAPYWKPKAEFEGDLGRIYGVQWRHWAGKVTKAEPDFTHVEGSRLAGVVNVERAEIDQLQILIDGLKTDPNGRRHILTAWNPGELDQMALPPCHVMSQFYVNKNKELSCHMYQRSVDVFLGLPFNIASYALLTHMLAHVCGMKVGDLIISTGDTHIYKNHFDQVNKQLKRTPGHGPSLSLNPDVRIITDFKMSDIVLNDYVCQEAINGKMAV